MSTGLQNWLPAHSYSGHLCFLWWPCWPSGWRGCKDSLLSSGLEPVFPLWEVRTDGANSVAWPELSWTNRDQQCAAKRGHGPQSAPLLFQPSCVTWERYMDSIAGSGVCVAGLPLPSRVHKVQPAQHSTSPHFLSNRLQGWRFSSLWLLSVSFCKARHSCEGRWDHKAGHKGWQSRKSRLQSPLPAIHFAWLFIRTEASRASLLNGFIHDDWLRRSAWAFCRMLSRREFFPPLNQLC